MPHFRLTSSSFIQFLITRGMVEERHRSNEYSYICRWVGEKYDGIRCCWNPKQFVVYPATKEGRRGGKDIEVAKLNVYLIRIQIHSQCKTGFSSS
jgi:hypothetical protein